MASMKSRSVVAVEETLSTIIWARPVVVERKTWYRALVSLMLVKAEAMSMRKVRRCSG